MIKRIVTTTYDSLIEVEGDTLSRIIYIREEIISEDFEIYDFIFSTEKVRRYELDGVTFFCPWDYFIKNNGDGLTFSYFDFGNLEVKKGAIEAIKFTIVERGLVLDLISTNKGSFHNEPFDLEKIGEKLLEQFDCHASDKNKELTNKVIRLDKVYLNFVKFVDWRYYSVVKNDDSFIEFKCPLHGIGDMHLGIEHRSSAHVYLYARKSDGTIVDGGKRKIEKDQTSEGYENIYKALKHQLIAKDESVRKLFV
ncbi:MAG TPA: hypothetical protein DHV28_17230 [Ignavibacteriales bacterium]|nr:hypothetical protein [Ignavibacteriales bacterium]